MRNDLAMVAKISESLDSASGDGIQTEQGEILQTAQKFMAN